MVERDNDYDHDNVHHHECGRETRARQLLNVVLRDFERKLSARSAATDRLLGIAKKILGQKTNSKKKKYSVHAPEVVCMAKGKTRVKYEFGSKVSVATAVKGSWIVGVNSFPDAPFDGHTVPDVLTQIKSMTGAFPRAAYCDRGYQGSAGLVFSTDVFVQGKSSKESSDAVKMKLRGRAATLAGNRTREAGSSPGPQLPPGASRRAVQRRDGRLRLQLGSKLYRAVLLRIFAAMIECILAFRPAFCRC